MNHTKPPIRLTGYIKWIASERGYGFLTGDNDIDYFFNVVELQNYVSPGDRVSFLPVSAQKGPKALKITSIDNE